MGKHISSLLCKIIFTPRISDIVTIDLIQNIMISPSASNVDLTTSYFDPLFLIKQVETEMSDGDGHLFFPFDATYPTTAISKNDDLLDLTSSFEAISSFPAVRNHTQTIHQYTECGCRLAKRDVLFGRGHGSSQFQGNKAFRGFIRNYKELYGESDSKTKRLIGQESYKAWISIGGRFLKQDGDVWVEAEEEKVINKIRMTLRQKEKRIKPSCNEQEDLLRNKNIMDIIAEAVAAFECLMPSLVTDNGYLMQF